MRLVRTALVGAGCLWVALVPVSVAAQAGTIEAEQARPDETWLTDWLNRIDREFSRDIVRKLAAPHHEPVGTKVAQKTESRPGGPGEVRRDAGGAPGHGLESQVANWVERVQDWLARAASTTQGKIMRPLSSPAPETPRQDEVAGLTSEAAAKLKRDLMDRKRYDGDEASVQRAEADKRADEARRRETEEVLRRDLMERKKYDLNLVGQVKPEAAQPQASGAQDAEAQQTRDLAERRRAEEAEVRRKADEQQAADAKAAEDRRLADEAAARRKAAEQAAAAKAAEDRRLADEAAARRKATEQAAAAKAAEDKRLADEAAARRKAAEQAVAAKAAEDRRLADEAEARRKAAEQAAAVKAAEAKRVADAAEAKRIADEKAAAPKIDPAKRWIEAETMRRTAEQKAREADRKRAAEEAEAKRKAEEAEAKRKADAARMGAAASKMGDDVLARGAKGGAARDGGKGIVEEGSTDRELAEAGTGTPGRKGKHARKSAKVTRHHGRCRNAGRRVTPPATYVVARGDTLWDIAKAHYRKGARYRLIYRANRAKISNPDLIYPCQRLFLPARHR